MTSSLQLIVHSLLVLALLNCSTARRPYIPGKSEAPLAPQEIQVIDPMEDIQRRVTDMETAASTMKNQMRQMATENTRLHNEVGSMKNLVRTLDEAHKRVEELQWLLEKFEQFFGLLYTDLPEVFSEEMEIKKRMSRLNEYIGNKEADLMSLRAYYPTERADPDPQHAMNEDLLGIALTELTASNDDLRTRLDTMESDTVSVGRVGTSSKTQDTADIEERLERLERLTLTTLTDVTASGPQGKVAVGTSLSESGASNDDITALRSATSTRKSVFSAAATSPAFGVKGEHRPIHLSHLHCNKGNHFNRENSTFICGITGYYYLTFTVRSYDGQWLGVNLLLNGNHVASISAEPDEAMNRMMSQSVVVHLTAGDHVWLAISPSTAFAIYSDDNKYTTFSGFLLFKGS